MSITYPFQPITYPFQPITKSPAPSISTSSSSVETAIAAKNVGMMIQSPSGQVPVLKNIDLAVKSGTLHLLMGPSGAGKTTLLLILSGLLSPTSGNVLLLGENITLMSKRQQERFRLQHIGFITQDFNLFPALTAAENILLAFSLKGIRGRTAQKATGQLLAQVGLAAQANYLPRQLSGGQQQRVAIARALANQPQLIMADEPTAALDSHTGHAVMALLQKLTQERGCTVLMITHDQRIIDVADQVTEVQDGQITGVAI